MRFLISCVSLVALLSACGGGGGGGDKDSVCSDFQYQQDAQSAFSNGAKQLDRDNDGVACESLPSRPAGSGGTSVGGSLIDFGVVVGQGIVAALKGGGGAYSLEYSGDGIGGGISSISPQSAGGALEIISDQVEFRYARTSNGGFVTWSRASSRSPSSQGVGVFSSDAATLAEMAGTYTLLGQRCDSAKASCRVTYATARISASGTLQLCPEAAYSEYCADRDIRTLEQWHTGYGAVANMWSLGSSSVLLGSGSRHTLAFTYKNQSLVGNTNNYVSTDMYTYFGQRADVAVTTFVPFQSMVGFDSTGTLRNAIPDVATRSVSAISSIPDLFIDTAGNLHLRSTTGQLVSWSSVEGLRLFSTP